MKEVDRLRRENALLRRVLNRWVVTGTCMDLDPIQDRVYYPVVLRSMAQAGLDGFGALMRAAQLAWQEWLEAQGEAGGEFVVGPCRATLQGLLKESEETLTAHEPDIQVDYLCDGCGAKGVKLWREYNTFADAIFLRCAWCASGFEGKKGAVDSNGCRESKYGRTDKIGNLVPAVPVSGEPTYWGYTSSPVEAVHWWRTLPTHPGGTQ